LAPRNPPGSQRGVSVGIAVADPVGVRVGLIVRVLLGVRVTVAVQVPCATPQNPTCVGVRVEVPSPTTIEPGR
jgi:hypothetical protein